MIYVHLCPTEGSNMEPDHLIHQPGALEKERNSLARDRTRLAAERTFLSWISALLSLIRLSIRKSANSLGRPSSYGASLSSESRFTVTEKAAWNLNLAMHGAPLPPSRLLPAS
jgi:hypothetical protein